MKNFTDNDISQLSQFIILMVTETVMISKGKDILFHIALSPQN